MHLGNELLRPEYIWILIGILMIWIEFSTPGFVVFFFGIGAFVVSILLFCGIHLSINMQIILFLVVSILSLIVLRKWFRSMFKGIWGSKDKMPINIESNIGETAIVIDQIQPLKLGKIELHGTPWKAKAVSDETIQKGVRIEIVSQDNLTFTVKRFELKNELVEEQKDK